MSTTYRDFVTGNMFKVSGRWLLPDESHNVSYGKWYCLQCDACFFGGGETCHKRTCPSVNGDYTDKNLIYIYGPNESGAFAPRYFLEPADRQFVKSAFHVVRKWINDKL